MLIRPPWKYPSMVKPWPEGPRNFSPFPVAVTEGVEDRPDHRLPVHAVRIERRALGEPAGIRADLDLGRVDPGAVGALDDPRHAGVLGVLAARPRMEAHRLAAPVDLPLEDVGQVDRRRGPAPVLPWSQRHPASPIAATATRPPPGPARAPPARGRRSAAACGISAWVSFFSAASCARPASRR